MERLTWRVMALKRSEEIPCFLAYALQTLAATTISSKMRGSRGCRCFSTRRGLAVLLFSKSTSFWKTLT